METAHVRPFGTRTIIAAVLACALVFVFLRACFFTDEERAVRARLEDLRSLAEIKGEEPVFEQLARAKRLAAFFSDSCHFEWQHGERHSLQVHGRRDIQEKAFAARRQLNHLEVQLKDLAVRTAGGEATVELTAGALGSMPDTEGQFFDLHRVGVDLRKQDGVWTIARVRHLKNLRE